MEEYLLEAHNLTKLPEQIRFSLEFYCTAFFMMMMKFLNHEWDITKEVFAARMEACIPSELKAFISEPTQDIMPPQNKK